jgi:hypothetical protein
MRSVATNTARGTIYLMVSIIYGLYLWRQSLVLKKRKCIGLQKSKKLEGRMWIKHLVGSNLIRILFGTLLEYGVLRRYVRWWLLAWLHITWYLRRSVIIASMSKGIFFRVIWLSPRLDRQCSSSSFIYIRRSESYARAFEEASIIYRSIYLSSLTVYCSRQDYHYWLWLLKIKVHFIFVVKKVHSSFPFISLHRFHLFVLEVQVSTGIVEVAL